MTAMCSGSASSKTVAKQIKLLKTFSPLLIRLQCFDTVGWVAGRASGLEKTERWGAGKVICLE